ncbi:MAG: ABC transporter permease, partial [Polaromonas sp.]
MEPVAQTLADLPVATPRGACRRWLSGFGLSGLVGLAVLAFWILAALFGPAMLPRALAGSGSNAVFSPISAVHWLGTDYLGRDMLMRVINGA